METTSQFSPTLLVSGIVDSVEIIGLAFVILECNLLIFKQSLMSFDVYYKIINILIGVTADKINCDWYKPLYYKNLDLNISSKNASNVNMIGVYAVGILSIIKFTMGMGFVSIFDGYIVSTRLKILVLIIFVILLSINFLMVDTVFKGYRQGNVSYVFGYPLHWQTVNTACINNATVFLLTQLIQSIRRPDKLIFIPTLIKFKETQRQTKMNKITLDDHKSNSNSLQLSTYGTGRILIAKMVKKMKKIEIVLPYRLYINNKDRLYYFICVCGNEQVAKYIFSKTMFRCILIYLVIHLSIWLWSGYKMNIYLQIVLLCLNIMTGIICMLSFNFQIFKFYARTIAYVWKLVDVIIMVICMQIIEYQRKNYHWSSKYSSTESIIIATLGFFQYILIVIVVSSIQALTVIITIHSEWHAIIISNSLIIMAIVSFMINTVYYFTHGNENYFIWGLSLNTLIIEKGIDLSIFFLSQLYTNIKNGSKGIAVTGYVNKKWKYIKYNYNYNPYEIHVHDPNLTIELLAHIEEGDE